MQHIGIDYLKANGMEHILEEKGTFLMCVVFLCITVTHGTDESPLTFGLNRIADTTVGIMIALLINQTPTPLLH